MNEYEMIGREKERGEAIPIKYKPALHGILHVHTVLLV